jgi:hypothetical protein
MTNDTLRAIADLTVELTKLRQAECKHLAIENFGPELFHALILAWENAQPRVSGPAVALPSMLTS